MKPIVLAAAAAVIAVATASVSAPAHAEEAQLGLGLVRSADSAMFQADLDVFRHFGFQAATGQSIAGGNFSGSAGGRFYLLGGRISPYAGLLWDVQSVRETVPGVAGTTTDTRTTTLQYAGPTLGLRLKAHHGLGAFVEMQYLGRPDASNEPMKPSVGAGIQWWF